MSTPYTQTMLDEARAAYHQLMIGGVTASVRDQNGESVTYSQQSMSRLAAYIAMLERALGLCTDKRGPLRVWM